MPKAFASLCGRPLLRHAVDGLLGSGCVDQVVVAVGADDGALAEMALEGVTGQVAVVIGGQQRSDSVRAALDAVTGAEVVLVHDAARCLVPASTIRSVVQAVQAGNRAVVPVLPVNDTVKRVDDSGVVLHTVDRAALRMAQTPQGFETGLLRRAYAVADGAATDDSGLVERLDAAVTTVAGHPHAFKITTAFDLTVAEALAGGP